MSLALPEYVDVRTQGAFVLLSVGNVRWSLEYDVALQASMLLRACGKDAKRASGDQSMRWRATAMLTDLEAKKPRGRQRKRIGDALALRQIGVHREPVSNQVVLEIGRHELRLGYEGALQISQWLRVRGKEAQRYTGDRAHWSDVARASTRVAEVMQ